ncbi:hypothetical protein E2C01_098328 [Portunus trituberculatus]|uniref:Uncharacterized protein n=1 Tax=Portunus trituberculatus TaxID=210409 RepID=A0A5B7K6S2_PORTR|nr:hypothetical protein [Portunus trituberculatus]
MFGKLKNRLGMIPGRDIKCVRFTSSEMGL